MNREEFESEFAKTLGGIRLSQAEIDHVTRDMPFDSMVVHFQYLDDMREDQYTLEEIGSLVVAMQDFISNGEEPEFNDRGMRQVWNRARSWLMSDIEKRRHKVIVNRLLPIVAAKKKQSPLDATGCQREPLDTVYDSESVNGSGTVYDSESVNGSGIEYDFANVSGKDKEKGSGGKPEGNPKWQRLAEIYNVDLSKIPEDTRTILDQCSDEELEKAFQNLAVSYPLQ